jgi:hypothetical protein
MAEEAGGKVPSPVGVVAERQLQVAAGARVGDGGGTVSAYAEEPVGGLPPPEVARAHLDSQDTGAAPNTEHHRQRRIADPGGLRQLPAEGTVHRL